MFSDNYFRTFIGQPICEQVGRAIAINRRSQPVSKDSVIAKMRTMNPIAEISIYHIDTYSSPGEIDEEWYDLFDDGDRSLVLGRLFDLSLTHNIVWAAKLNEEYDDPRMMVFIAPTKDGQSNIDADVIEFIMNRGKK